MIEISKYFTQLHLSRQATTRLSVAQVEKAIENLTKIRDEKILAQEKTEKEAARKLAIIEELKRHMIEEGIKISDILAGTTDTKTQYFISRKDPVSGDVIEKYWSGKGRMPRVFKIAIDRGSSLEDFAIQ